MNLNQKKLTETKMKTAAFLEPTNHHHIKHSNHDLPRQISYPQWQSLSQTPEEPVQEQKMPSSSRRFLIFFVRYMS